MHDKATCPDYKGEAEIGKVEMCSPENPFLGCALVNINFAVLPFAFPLGELSGQFHSKADATYSLMDVFYSR